MISVPLKQLISPIIIFKNNQFIFDFSKICLCAVVGKFNCL
ncbi:hypothetical protein OUM_0206 [Helicobacter pylori R038b]|uniref:Uncharacterized protein n=1 Tax=Helicobacter pylori R038b TaxID=1145115 RepID=K2L2E9_HELPX|nr:hypothetical protein OUM_0206 [Helicobacter pylori R038b]